MTQPEPNQIYIWFWLEIYIVLYIYYKISGNLEMVLVPKYTIPMDKLELSLERICQSETTNNRLLHPIQTKRGYKPMKVIFQCPIIEPVSYRITLPCHPIKQSNSSHLMLKPNPLCLELLNWSHKLPLRIAS